MRLSNGLVVKVCYKSYIKTLEGNEHKTNFF